MLRTALVLVCVVVLAGCYKPYIRRSEDAPAADADAPTLMGALVVDLNRVNSVNESGQGLMDLMNNATLDTFGQEIGPVLSDELKNQGFAVTTDRSTAAILDEFAFTKDNAALTTLTGHWVDPSGSNVDADRFRALIGAEGQAAQIGGKLSRLEGAKDKQFFAFTKIQNIGTSGCGCGGCWFYSQPMMRVNTIVLNRDGKIVHDSQGVGKGKGGVFFVDRSPASLRVAVDDALAGLKVTPVEPLAY